MGGVERAFLGSLQNTVRVYSNISQRPIREADNAYGKDNKHLFHKGSLLAQT